MTTNLLVNRTSIQARTTPDASERLARHWMRQHSRTSVVENNDVQFIGSFVIRVALGAGDERGRREGDFLLAAEQTP